MQTKRKKDPNKFSPANKNKKEQIRTVLRIEMFSYNVNIVFAKPI